MRSHHISLSFVLIASALLTGCFSSNSGGSGTDGGTLHFDSGSPTLDSGSQDGTTPPEDSSTGDALPPTDAPQEAAQEAGPDGSSGSFSTSPVDFGLADCGGQPSPSSKSYTFTNTGPLPVTWSAAVGTPIFAIQGASSGTVAPGEQGTITVGVNTIPATSTAGTALTDTLTLTTNVPGYTTVLVPLTVTPQGGTLTVSSAPGFGSVTVTTTDTQPVTLQNVGNAAVQVTLGTPSDPQFKLTYTGAPSAASIGAGSSLAGASASFTPSAVGTASATASIQVTGAVCGTSATSIALGGTGIAAPLSVGPSPLNFSTVTCGQTAQPQAVTLKNSSAASISYTAVLGHGTSSPYTLSSSSGSVPANGQVTVTVTPAQVPLAANLTAGFYNDTLTVTGQGQPPVVVPLEESAGGAILALNMATSNFGNVSNTTASLPFSVTNTGNESATVTVSVTGTNYSEAFPVNTVAASGTENGTVSFTALTNGGVVGSLSISAPNLCNPPPLVITLDAVGQVPVATFSHNPLAVTATCGGGVGAAALTITNTGNAPLSIGSLNVANGHFKIGAVTNPIAPGANGTINITGVLPANPTGGNVLADTLTFATNEVGSPVYSVPVNDTVVGANLAVVGNPVTLNNCGYVAYSIKNTGNNAANSVTIVGAANYDTEGSPVYFSSTGGESPGEFDSAQTINAGATLGDNVAINNGCTAAGSVVVGYTTTGPVCIGAAPTLTVHYVGNPCCD
jgi:hypothetical protein